jgi:hypothetical protein
MLSLLNDIVSAPIKDLVKGVTAHQGGQWIEKKQLRELEAQSKTARKFNPKAVRTRSF